MTKQIKSQKWLIIAFIAAILIADTTYDYIIMQKNKSIFFKSNEINIVFKEFIKLNYLTVEINNEQKNYLESKNDTVKIKINLLQNQEFEITENISYQLNNAKLINKELNRSLQVFNKNKIGFNSAKNMNDWILSNSNEISILNEAIRDIEKQLNGIQLKLLEDSKNNSSSIFYTDVLLTILIIFISIRLVFILYDNKKQRELVTELKLLNDTKDKFFSIISHDLKNPFSAVLGFSKLLLENVEKNPIEKTKDNIAIIYDASKRIYELLENLLEWSRLQTSKIEPNIQPISIDKTIPEVIQLLCSYANQKQICLNSENNVKSDLLADKNMFQTVLRNLITNAIKFTKTNGVVTVKSYENSDSISISVEDNGVGIEKEKIERLFVIDSNISTRGTQGEKGTGLGLLICKELIEMNKGKIEVESSPGIGTKFTINLPKSENNSINPPY
jgi:signal transduction histidine kinase